jgi:hypothetical protein
MPELATLKQAGTLLHFFTQGFQRQKGDRVPPDKSRKLKNLVCIQVLSKEPPCAFKAAGYFQKQDEVASLFEHAVRVLATPVFGNKPG